MTSRTEKPVSRVELSTCMIYIKLTFPPACVILPEAKGGMGMTTKEAVLQALRGTNFPLSGERLARQLGISRNAVWKAIRGLQKDGCRISASTRLGYRLVEMPDMLSEAEIARYLAQEEIGRHMEIHPELDSTNNRAKQLAAQGAPHGTLVAADSQTAGRGRFSRQFYSPLHSGIYMSLILRPALPAERAVMITSLAAVAAARAIESLADVEVGIKWVNDLYINRRKCCGILCEASMDFESGGLEYVVVGIGVNVARMAFPEDLKDIATSVGNECGLPVSRNRLIAEIANQIAALYPDLAEGGFMAESRQRSIVIGKEITVLGSGNPYTATATDIDGQGRLIVRRPDGRTEALNSGEISIKL